MPLYVLSFLVTGAADTAAPFLGRQHEQLRELHARGKLRAAGMFKAQDGLLAILDVEDRKEAEAICRESPLVESGQAAWMLREWSEIDFG